MSRSRQRIEKAVTDLFWSLWSEMGVSGVVRRHGGAVIDPEPLIVTSPAVFALDPRLRDQVYGWCVANAGWLSMSRVQSLSEALDERAEVAFAGLSATLKAHAQVRWPIRQNVGPWKRVPEVSPLRLPIERPALLRFRLRALCGVGARADVLTALLAEHDTWLRASGLAEDGYSKRNVARILSELTAAGIARSQRERNVLTFKLVDPETLLRIVQGANLSFPSWNPIFGLVLEGLSLSAIESKAEAARRVEAHSTRERLSELAIRLSMEPPPPTRGAKDAWGTTIAWITEVLEALANGSSAVM